LRVSAVWGLPTLLQELGVPLAEALAEAELPRDLFGSRENLATYRQLERLMLVCERRAHCDYIGLLIGQRSRLVDMGLVGQVALCSSTAGEAIQSFVDHFNLHDTAATCVLIESGQYVRFVYSVLEHGMDDTRHFQLGGITIAYNILQDICGHDWTPTEVNFASREPSNVRPFQKFFRGPVRFDKEDSSLVFARQWLEKPLTPVDPAFRLGVERAVRTQQERMLADFPATVRRILRKQLLLGSFTMDDIAAMLSMHRRTLDRHLQDHGVQYSELFESVREDVARHLLRDTQMPIHQIAESIRFSSAANFATAFRRRVGVTPSAYRRGA
jgi:AraC-like DNA-binding protein